MPKYKAELTKIATVLLAVSFFLQVFTVIGMVFFQGLALKLGLFRLLVKAHTYNGYIFVGLVMTHIYFNWWWVRANILKKEKR